MKTHLRMNKINRKPKGYEVREGFFNGLYELEEVFVVPVDPNRASVSSIRNDAIVPWLKENAETPQEKQLLVDYTDIIKDSSAIIQFEKYFVENCYMAPIKGVNGDKAVIYKKKDKRNWDTDKTYEIKLSDKAKSKVGDLDDTYLAWCEVSVLATGDWLVTDLWKNQWEMNKDLDKQGYAGVPFYV